MSKFSESVLVTALGGIALFLATIILNAFFSSPPSRAEFNSHISESGAELKNINYKLDNIKRGQDRIIQHLLTKPR